MPTAYASPEATALLTDSTIEQFRIRAGEHGDDGAVDICRAALREADTDVSSPRTEARMQVAKMIANGVAQRDDLEIQGYEGGGPLCLYDGDAGRWWPRLETRDRDALMVAFAQQDGAWHS